MKHLIQRWIIAVLRLAGRFAYRLSREQRTHLGHIVGDAMRMLSSERRRTALENLAIAFPDAPIAWRQATMRSSYHNLGVTLVELLTFPLITPREAREMMDLQGIDRIESALQQGSGVLLLSGHFGNWELLGFTLPLYVDISTTIIVAKQSNKIAETYLSWYRLRTGNRTAPVHNAARSIIHAVQNGEAIAMLADQAAPPEHNVFVPFFGRAASTYQAPARIALRYNVPMFVAFAERLENGCYRAVITPIPHEDLSCNAEGIRTLTERHTAALETAIRQHPDLWVWQHKRWKYLPSESLQ